MIFRFSIPDDVVKAKYSEFTQLSRLIKHEWQVHMYDCYYEFRMGTFLEFMRACRALGVSLHTEDIKFLTEWFSDCLATINNPGLLRSGPYFQGAWSA